MTDIEMASLGITKNLREKFRKIHEWYIRKLGTTLSVDEFLNFLIDSNYISLKMIEEEKKEKLESQYLDWSKKNPEKSRLDFFKEKLNANK